MTTMTRTRLTYGVLPSRELFAVAFEAECPTGYRVELKGVDARALDRSGAPVDTIGVWSREATWAAVNALRLIWEKGDDDAGTLASAILETLGFEWI